MQRHHHNSFIHIPAITLMQKQFFLKWPIRWISITWKNGLPLITWSPTCFHCVWLFHSLASSSSSWFKHPKCLSSASFWRHHCIRACSCCEDTQRCRWQIIQVCSAGAIPTSQLWVPLGFPWGRSFSSFIVYWPINYFWSQISSLLLISFAFLLVARQWLVRLGRTCSFCQVTWIEASRMALHRFGNTSSGSIWYELAYIEAKCKVKKENRMWQIAFGSGFKCNNAVWKAELLGYQYSVYCNLYYYLL